MKRTLIHGTLASLAVLSGLAAPSGALAASGNLFTLTGSGLPGFPGDGSRLGRVLRGTAVPRPRRS